MIGVVILVSIEYVSQVEKREREHAGEGGRTG